MAQKALAQQIQQLIADLPQEVVSGLAAALQESESGRWSQLRANALRAASQPDVRQQILAFIEQWRAHYPEVLPDSVSLALLAAAEAAGHYRRSQQLELVWTGPDSRVIPLRRTDQALLELIDSARRDLHIVSFAVYKIENIAQAIIAAADRGVAVSIYLETPSASEGKMSFDTVGALGREVANRARLYVWPLEKRPLADNGNVGALHAKIALADGRRLLISSANLTGYAMTLNMELGVLINGGDLPPQVDRHLARLVEQGVFRKLRA